MQWRSPSGYGVDEGGAGPGAVHRLPLSLVQVPHPAVRPKVQGSFHRVGQAVFRVRSSGENQWGKASAGLKAYQAQRTNARTNPAARGAIASQRSSFPRGGNGSLSALLVRLSKGGVHGVFRDFPEPQAAVGTFLLEGDVVH